MVAVTGLTGETKVGHYNHARHNKHAFKITWFNFLEEPGNNHALQLFCWTRLTLNMHVVHSGSLDNSCLLWFILASSAERLHFAVLAQKCSACCECPAWLCKGQSGMYRIAPMQLCLQNYLYHSVHAQMPDTIRSCKVNLEALSLLRKLGISLEKPCLIQVAHLS